jgi:hypothetical protein
MKSPRIHPGSRISQFILLLPSMPSPTRTPAAPVPVTTPQTPAPRFASHTDLLPRQQNTSIPFIHTHTSISLHQPLLHNLKQQLQRIQRTDIALRLHKLVLEHNVLVNKRSWRTEIGNRNGGEKIVVERDAHREALQDVGAGVAAVGGW